MIDHTLYIIGVNPEPALLSLRLTWNNGQTTRVNLSDFVADKPILTSLHDPNVFARAKLGEDGLEITWDDGGDLSIASSTLQRLAAEQSDDPACRFDAWMERHGLSADQVVSVLGIPRRSVLHYRTGKRPIPRYITLACVGWEIERQNQQSNRL